MLIRNIIKINSLVHPVKTSNTIHFFNERFLPSSCDELYALIISEHDKDPTFKDRLSPRRLGSREDDRRRTKDERGKRNN